MKQGTKVKWVDGMGIENHGEVDWEALESREERIPIRTKEGFIVRIKRESLEELKNTYE